MRSKFTLSFCLTAALATGCATGEKSARIVPPGQVTVVKSYGTANDFSNVRLVTAAKLAQGNAINILTLPRVLVGGSGPLYLEKTEAYGALLETEDKKPVPSPLGDGAKFVESVQVAVNDFLKDSPAFAQKTYKKSINVSTPVVRLIYESLTGDDAQKYRLHVSMVARKVTEAQPSLMDALKQSAEGKQLGFVSVDCGYVSPQALPLAQWAQTDYDLLKTEVKNSGEICRKKIVDQLPDMLSR